MFFKTNKCIFISVRTKAFTMQSKNKMGAWAHMRPPFLQQRKEFGLGLSLRDDTFSNAAT